ncbi:MAG: hypothetical protein AAGE61_15100 [Pseudomonadota bacterium]
MVSNSSLAVTATNEAWVLDVAMNFMADPDYKPQLEARTAGSTSLHFVIEGIDDLA